MFICTDRDYADEEFLVFAKDVIIRILSVSVDNVKVPAFDVKDDIPDEYLARCITYGRLFKFHTEQEVRQFALKFLSLHGVVDEIAICDKGDDPDDD
jgi:hypothetical protein